MFKEAIDAYISAEMWAKAREVSANYAPKMKSYVEDLYVESLKNKGDANQLLSVNVESGLNLYVKNGEWEKCLAVASQQVNTLKHSRIRSY